MSARVLTGASAGAALFRDGTQRRVPGLADDGLLVDGSPVTVLARAYLADGQVFASFLWPRGNPDPEQHVRVTVLASPAQAPLGVLGAVVLAPATDLRGLTPRELQVLGLVIEGWSNRQIAVALIVTPRTVATHLEHILAKLDAPTRTLAAVRAERQGPVCAVTAHLAVTRVGSQAEIDGRETAALIISRYRHSHIAMSASPADGHQMAVATRRGVASEQFP
jgi:DNA-binding CsgD family transcriptional regulator